MWWRLVLKEMYRRKWGFLLSSLAVAVAVAVWVLVQSFSASIENETRVITAKMGQNIQIMPASASLDAYYRGELGEDTLPESILPLLVDPNAVVLVSTGVIRTTSAPGENQRIRIVDAKTAETIMKSPEGRRTHRYSLPELADHYAGELQARMPAEAAGRKMAVILTGQRKEEGRKSDKPITKPAERGKAYLGSAVAEELGLAKGGKISVGGRTFEVQRVEDPQGTFDDIRVYVALGEAQQMLNLPGRINRIMALSCLCEQLTTEQLADVLELHIKQRAQADGAILPVRAIPMLRMATARDRLRRVVEGAGQVLTPALGLICAVLVCGYFYFNVRERQQEMGILLAIGYKPGSILLAILFKLLAVSLIGGALGVIGGMALAGTLGARIPLPQVVYPPHVWPIAMSAALGITLLAGIYPLILAARTEAAEILRNS